MDGSGSNSIGGSGLPPIPPPNNSNSNASTGEQGDDSAVARRRAQNREYSQRYRVRQHERVMQLEVELKTLQDRIAENSSQAEFVENTIGPRLLADQNSIEESNSHAAARLAASKAEADMLQSLMERAELQKAQILEMLKTRGE